MKPPFMIVNFKAYPEALGKKALELAKLCERISKAMKVEIAVAPQAVDLRMIAESTKIKVFCQHIDAEPTGAYTGHITAESALDAGAYGTLINHSEMPVTIEQAAKIIEICKEYDLRTVYCTATPVNVDRIRKYAPDYIAIEPPELIGGNISVSNAKPQLVTESITRSRGIPVVCGAGIKTKDDVVKAVELGVFGILLASGIVKADNQEKAIIALAEGLKKK